MSFVHKQTKKRRLKINPCVHWAESSGVGPQDPSLPSIITACQSLPNRHLLLLLFYKQKEEISVVDTDPDPVGSGPPRFGSEYYILMRIQNPVAQKLITI